MKRALDNNRPACWTLGITAMVDFVTDCHAIRSRGNATAHSFSNEDIWDAIETFPFSVERTKLSELWHLVVHYSFCMKRAGLHLFLFAFFFCDC